MNHLVHAAYASPGAPSCQVPGTARPVQRRSRLGMAGSTPAAAAHTAVGRSPANSSPATPPNSTAAMAFVTPLAASSISSVGRVQVVEPSTTGMPFVHPHAASSGGSRGQVAEPCADAEADEAQSVTSGRSWQTSLSGLSLAETPDSLFATPAAHFGAGMAGRETPFATPAFDLSAAKAASAKPGVFAGSKVNGGIQESPVPVPDEARLRSLMPGQLPVVSVAKLLAKAVDCWLHTIQLLMLLLSVPFPGIQVRPARVLEEHIAKVSGVYPAVDQHSGLALVDSDAAEEPALTPDAASRHGSPANAAESLAETPAASDLPAAASAASPTSASEMSRFAAPSQHSEQGSTTSVGPAAAEATGGPPCSEGHGEDLQQEAKVRLHGSCQYGGEADLQVKVTLHMYLSTFELRRNMHLCQSLSIPYGPCRLGQRAFALTLTRLSARLLLQMRGWPSLCRSWTKSGPSCLHRCLC